MSATIEPEQIESAVVFDEPSNGQPRSRRATPVEFVPVRQFSSFVVEHRRLARWTLVMVGAQVAIGFVIAALCAYYVLR